MYRIALLTLCALGCSGASGSSSTSSSAAVTATNGPTSTDNQSTEGGDTLQKIDWQSPLQRDHALVGKIWDTRAGRFATRDELAARAAKARFVLLGETHDNADHHALQAAVMDMVTTAKRKPAVVFEMIESGRQDALDKQLRAAPGDVDGLGKALEWDTSGWPAWAMYRPVFVSALAASLPIIGAALPRAEAMDLARGKRQLPAALVTRYQLDGPLPGALNEQLVAELKASHCGHMPDAMIAPMASIQRARDAIMADGLSTRATTDGAILIAGGGHVRNDRGVPWYLQRAGHSEADILAIGFIQVAADSLAPGDYAGRYDGVLPFDYLWFTPVANDIDRCKELEERMKKMKAKKSAAGEHKAPTGQ